VSWSRRYLLGAVAAGAASPAWVALAAEPTAAGGDRPLQAAFDRFSASLNTGDVAGFLALFRDDAAIIDEDAPFRMSKAEFVDHLGFHGKNLWEGFAWVPRGQRIAVRGATGLVAGSATFRGKPRDAGFRLRHMLYTMGWHRDADAWRIVLFHQSPLVGHIERGSPG